MAIVVEDGSIVSGANAYVDVAYVDAYWLARETTSLAAGWAAATTASKESAILVATQYLDYQYKWLGIPQSNTQDLKWPREDIVEERGNSLYGIIPDEIKIASCELAGRAIANANLFCDSLGKQIIKEKVDVIEVAYKTEPILPEKTYTLVDNLVRIFLASKGGQTVFRA